MGGTNDRNGPSDLNFLGMRSLCSTTILLIALLVGFITPASGAVAGFGHSAFAVNSEVTVYRVFGGDARAQGFSWTTTHPESVSNFRNLAGLPSGGASGATNTADFMIQGRASPEK